MKKLAKVLSLVILLLLIIGLSSAGCKRAGKNLVAIVNGEEITMEKLDEEFTKIFLRYQNIPQQDLGKEQKKQMQKKILVNLMEKVLLDQQAAKAKIKVTVEEINKKYQQFQGERSKEEFKKQLKRAGMTEKDFKNQIKDSFIREKLKEKLVKIKKLSEKELKDYYNKNKAQFTGAEGEIRPYQELKSRIEQLLKSQRRQEAWTDWLDQVKAESEVRIYFW